MKGNRGGRPSKPTALHKLHGTRIRRARNNEPDPPGDLREPPDWFTPSMKDGWWYAINNAPPHLLRKLDRGMLAIWVEAEDRHRQAIIAQAELNRRGPQLPYVLKSPIGLVVSPYVEIIDKASKSMFRAAVEMGFSPAARPRIRTEIPIDIERPDDGPPNPWRILSVIDGGKPH